MQNAVLTKKASLWSSLILLVLCQTSHAALNLVAPDIAENGGVVPVSLQIDPPLVEGDSAVILTNGSAALTTSVTGTMSVNEVSTRVRAFSVGPYTLEAKVRRSNGEVELVSKEITVNIAANPVVDENDPPTNFSVKYRENDGVVKMLVTSSQDAGSYVGEIRINTPTGVLTSLGTPCVSKNPYFSFATDADLSGVVPDVFAGTETLFCTPSSPDADSDGVADDIDNCPLTSNPTQEDTDGDGEGNACDADDDNDGLSDSDEVNLHNTNPLIADTDRDGVNDGDEVAAGTDPLVNNRAVMTIINSVLFEE